MEIKSLLISGFKNITQKKAVKYNFFSHTVISGENFSGKTTIGEAICWAFCGCNINGSSIYDSLLLNNESTVMSVEVEFIDKNGATHILKREKVNSTKIYLDGKLTTTNILGSYIGDKEIFMNTFIVGYFQRYSPKEAREFLSKVLPRIDKEEIRRRLPPEFMVLIPDSMLLNSNELLKECRTKLKELEKEEQYLKGQLKILFDNFKGSNMNKVIDKEDDIQAMLEELKEKHMELLKLNIAMSDTTALIGRRELLRREYEILKSKLLKVIFKPGDTCPSCLQPLTEECIKLLEEHCKKENKEIASRLDTIVKEGKTLSRLIEEQEQRQKQKKANETSQDDDDYSAEIKDLENQMLELKKKLDQIAIVDAVADMKANAAKQAEEINKKLSEQDEEKAHIAKVIEAAKACNAIRTDLQFANISANLNKVSLKLEKVVKSTGELKGCFELMYEGKELMLLSNSEKIRAFLEISNLINKKTELRLPIFIDNAESITHYDKPDIDIQVFEAVVVRGQALNVQPQG